MNQQRLWQLKQRANGCCELCAKPAQGRSWCDDCAKRRGIHKRHPLKSQWLAVNWNLSDREIAAQLNVSRQAVQTKRHR